MDSTENILTMDSILANHDDNHNESFGSIDLAANGLMDDEAFNTMLDGAFSGCGTNDDSASMDMSDDGQVSVEGVAMGVGTTDQDPAHVEDFECNNDHEDPEHKTTSDQPPEHLRKDSVHPYYEQNQDPSTPSKQFGQSNSNFVGVVLPAKDKKGLGGAISPSGDETSEKSLAEVEDPGDNGYDLANVRAGMKATTHAKVRAPFMEESSPEPETGENDDLGKTSNSTAPAARVQSLDAEAEQAITELERPSDEDDLYRAPTPTPDGSARRQSNSDSPRGEDSGSYHSEPAPPNLRDGSNTMFVDDSSEGEDEGDVIEELKRTNFHHPDVAEFGVPQISLEKLVALVIAKSSGRSLTLPGIIKAIKKVSSHYREQEIEGDAVAHPWTKNVEDTLHGYDFPTIPTRNDENGELEFKLQDGGEWFVLNKQPKVPHKVRRSRSSRLLSLPLELKLMIFTFALRMPLPNRWGWKPDETYTLNAPNTYHKYDRPPNRFTTLAPGTDWELRSLPVQDLLSLALVCKGPTSTQKDGFNLSETALKVFYRTNAFYFPYPKLMGRFLTGLPNRREWIRNIVLNWRYGMNAHECRRSMCKLFETRLRNLHLIIDENAMLITHCQVDIAAVAGVKFLAELSGVEKVTFAGEFKNLKRYLAAADITSEKARDRGYDTDEEIEAQIMHRRKMEQKRFGKSFRQNRKEESKRKTERKHDEHKKEVARRQALRAERVQDRLDRLAYEKAERRRKKMERRKRREEEREAEAEEKAEHREMTKAARARKRRADAEAKIARQEAREAARAEKRELMAEKEQEKQERAEARREKRRVDAEKQSAKQREARAKISETRAKMKAALGKSKPAAKARGKAAPKRRTEMYSALHDTSESSSEESSSDDDSDASTESDYGKKRPTTARKAPVSSQARKRPASTLAQEWPSTDEEPDTRAPPAKKSRASNAHKGTGSSIKLAANNVKRGTGGPAGTGAKTKNVAANVKQNAILESMRRAHEKKTQGKKGKDVSELIAKGLRPGEGMTVAQKLAQAKQNALQQRKDKEAEAARRQAQADYDDDFD